MSALKRQTTESERLTRGQRIDRGILYLLCLLILLLAQTTNLIFPAKFQQYRYLAESFLAGRLDFVVMPGTSWDDTALFGAARYWPLGSFPAVTLMPFVFLARMLGATFSQGYLAFVLLVWTCFLVFRLAEKLGKIGDERAWVALAFVGSSSYLAIALVPWSWHLAHLVAVWLSLIAIHEYLDRRRWSAIGFILGLVYATRPTAGLSVLFFAAALLLGDERWRAKRFNGAKFVAGFFVVVLLVICYNSLRFGSPFESGYNYQLGMKPEGPLVGPWNMLSNLRVFLIGVPIRIDRFPFVTADPFGMSVLLVSPWLLFVRPQRWHRLDSLLAINMAVTILVLLSWWSTGSNQMGYRFSLDFLPLLFWVLLRTDATKVDALFKVTVAASVLLNFYFLTTVFNG
jgi:hypothetical protein